jgi:hypothetical protein
MAMMSAATFRMPGNVTPIQNLFALYNGGANRVVRIRRIVLQVDTTGVLPFIMPLFKLCRIDTVSSGQTLTKVAWEATASHADIVARGRNTSDGGTQTNIVATPGETMWQQYASRLASNVGQIVGDDQNIAPVIIVSNPIVLRQNEGVMVYLEAPSANSNPTTSHYFVQCAWDEAVS